MFHRQNSKTNLPRYSRHDELKNPPNLALATLFCTSRGSKWLKRLKPPTPTRACRCRSRNGSEIGRVIWTSNEEKRGKRSTFRGPTYSRNSFSTEYGKPVCTSYTGTRVSFSGPASVAQNRKRFGASNDKRPR